MHDTVLSKALIGSDSRFKKLAMVVLGSLAIAIAAQISVPMFPVPMTLQTLAITVIGLRFGARMAAATVLVYLGQGAMGLPVFASGGFGLAWLMGPTSGFLWGFVGMAFLTGWLVENGMGRGWLRLFIAAVVPAALLYVPGVAVLAIVVPSLDLSGAFAAGALPFLIGDLVKSGIAALIVVGGWKLLKRR